MASNFYGVVFSDVRVFLIGLQVGGTFWLRPRTMP